MTDVFQQSAKLRSIIDNHGWTLYEIDNSTGNEPRDLQVRGPAESYQIGKEYICFPITQKGESLDAAVDKAIKEGRGPALDMNNFIVLFSRILFDGGLAYTIYPSPSAVNAEIPYDMLIEVFEKSFFIKTPGRSRKLEANLN